MGRILVIALTNPFWKNRYVVNERLSLCKSLQAKRRLRSVK